MGRLHAPAKLNQPHTFFGSCAVHAGSIQIEFFVIRKPDRNAVFTIYHNLNLIGKDYFGLLIRRCVYFIKLVTSPIARSRNAPEMLIVKN